MGRYYKLYWEGELLAEIHARDERAAHHKARDYLNSTGRLYDLSKLAIS